MFRSALGHYIKHPNDTSTIFNDDNVVIIKDKFPKSLRHYLVIPKSSKFTKLHPFEAFQDDEFYLLIKHYVEKAKQLMMEDLKHQGYKDLDNYIQMGVHAVPSMDNIHVHVMTKDFISTRMKHKKHYNSFTSKFFVNYIDLNPLGRGESLNSTKQDEQAEQDEQDQDSQDEQDHYSSDDSATIKTTIDTRDPHQLQAILKASLICCHCGTNFGNRFVNLKAHLNEEFKSRFGKNPPMIS